MKFAIIPWTSAFLQDRMFDISNELNYDHRMMQFILMKQEFERRKDELHTIDMYADLKSVDLFLFFEIDLEWIKKIVSMDLESRMVYCNAEPPIVNPLNSMEGFRKLFHYFPYIMTWNNDWIDGKRIFKRNIPYYFDIRYGNVPYADRKLITCIAGNKHSSHPDELYSEREKVIHYMEDKETALFDLYGSGWEYGKHPTYRGKVRDKADVYHQYRFALAFENMKNIKGYITEKILDCLTTGIVPIYFGAEDIGNYIPEECFILYEGFDRLPELVQKLKDMPEKVYNQYLKAARDFLASDGIRKFAGEEYAQNIYSLLENADMSDFQVKRSDILRLNLRISAKRTKKKMKKVLGR